jgi:hypothetical protein
MKKTNMAGTLYRLIYYSRNVIPDIAPDATVEETIASILSSARVANKANNITGALMFTASGFAQALEGARDVVERTFERICADPRHTDVTVLSFTPTERRCFPDSPLGFAAQTSADISDPLAALLGDLGSAGPRATTGSDVLRMLERVVRQEDAGVAA